MQPRARVDLSDFLTTTTNAHVRRGAFEYSVMRIGKKARESGGWKDRGAVPGNRVGVFLYCRQHAREGPTPLTCVETASQLLYNYALDRRTPELVDNLDIFILPSSNPDGSHFSRHNFMQQRRCMTNHCVIGGKATDDPFAANFWTARTPPGSSTAYTAIDPAARNVGAST